jgi:basic membrane lipoprotein Med (substrate-binding protein (PBP1-ABC) superfamily)
MRLQSLTVMTTMLVLLTIVCGCQRVSQQPAEFHVALVTPGPVSDAGWNAAAFSGLDKIGAELAAATAHMEAGSPAQFEESFRDFARRGSALIFGHGFEFQDAAATVGAEFPDTVFVVTSGLTTAENVGGLVFRLEEAAYLAGVMAAGVSSTGIAGTVGGMEIPPVRLVFDGFKRGFTDARPDGQVKEVFLGNWEDVASARQASLSLIEQGADILIHNADAAGLGVFQACRERAVLALGSNRDQAHVAPDVVLASAVMDIPEAMLRITKEVRAGTFTGRVYTFDLASGVVDLVSNPALANRLSAETHTAVEDARSRLLLGQVKLQHFGE